MMNNLVWKSDPNFCVSDEGHELAPTSHPKGDLDILTCQSECTPLDNCSAVEWFESGWGGSKCKLVLNQLIATKGDSGTRYEDATCYFRPGYSSKPSINL